MGGKYEYKIAGTYGKNNNSNGDFSQTNFFESNIKLETPSQYQIIQRNVTTNTANIKIEGTYTGNIKKLEVAYVLNNENIEIADFTPMEMDETQRKFSTMLTNQPAGQGNLIIRDSNNVDNYIINNEIGVGDIYLVAGQSNASGRGNKETGSSDYYLYQSPNRETAAKAYLFGNDDLWKDLKDPYDSSLNQIDGISADSKAAGSIFPRLATMLLENEDIPIAFVPSAYSGLSINAYQENYSLSNNSLNHYQSMIRRINEVGGDVRAVLWMLGETDADKMTTNQFIGSFNNMYTSFYRDTNKEISMLVGQIGSFMASRTSSRPSHIPDYLDDVRKAQRLVAEQDETENIKNGPLTYDLDLETGSDFLHYKTAKQMNEHAERWYLSIREELLLDLDIYTPELSKIEYDTSKEILELKFNQNLYIQNGNNDFTKVFRVYINDVLVEIDEEVSLINNDSVILKIKDYRLNIEDKIQVSYAAEFDGNKSQALYESTLKLPAVPFIKELVKIK